MRATCTGAPGRPPAGVLWNSTTGRGTAWRDDKRSRLYYDVATLTLATIFAARFVVQRYFYETDAVGSLGAAEIAMGYPLLASVSSPSPGRLAPPTSASRPYPGSPAARGQPEQPVEPTTTPVPSRSGRCCPHHPGRGPRHQPVRPARPDRKPRRPHNAP
jgi:hypothetical protein